MSSNCSANTSSSIDIMSSNVSSNKHNGMVNNEVHVGDVGCGAGAGRLRTTVPDIKKDSKYWERRRRNNEAARRSREKRRVNDLNMDHRIMELSQRNKILEQELFQIKVGGTTTTDAVPLNPFDSTIKKPKLTPIIPSATDSSQIEKIQTTHINGMVFPIFTTLNTAISSPDKSEPKDINGLPSAPCGFKLSVTSDASRYQTNLLTFSNIPLLSNLIATTNFCDDNIAKPTLLLPPFQIPSKSIDDTNGAEANLTTTVSDIHIANQFQPVHHCINSEMIMNEPVVVKDEMHEILDLRVKHSVMEECHYSVPGGLVQATTSSRVAESINNSFLSGPKQRKRGKGPSSTRLSCNRLSNRYSYNISRRRRLSEEHNRPLQKSLGEPIVLRSCHQIWNEVSSAVSQENERLFNSISSLTEEVKELKSVLLTIAASAIDTPVHFRPLLEHLKCQSRDRTEDRR